MLELVVGIIGENERERTNERERKNKGKERTSLKEIFPMKKKRILFFLFFKHII